VRVETPLVARARKLGPAFDLLANYRSAGGFFFERSGLGVAGTGVAARIRSKAGPERVLRLARQIRETLGGIQVDGDVSPVAVGAIPYDDRWPAETVVPSRTALRHEPGETWQIDVFPRGLPAPDHERERWTGRAVPHDAFDEIQLRPDPEPNDYAEAVAMATRRIRSGGLRKVVLARSLLVDAERELDPKQLLWRLRAVDPDCYAFAAPEPQAHPDPSRASGILVGASPELLVRRRGRDVRATPLAGSAPRFGDARRDRRSATCLLDSEKDREEHAVVVEDVARVLAGFCDRLTYPKEPELLGTANVWHLATPFQGRLHDPTVSVLELVAALHPTPAVCGMPREEAREELARLERVDRGCYAGPVGWMDGEGDGEWAIALRCAEITGSTARLFAGAGIVAESVPEEELDETERKFRALLDALRWS
jgi:isochorismate synthase